MSGGKNRSTLWEKAYEYFEANRGTILLAKILYV